MHDARSIIDRFVEIWRFFEEEEEELDCEKKKFEVKREFKDDNTLDV